MGLIQTRDEHVLKGEYEKLYSEAVIQKTFQAQVKKFVARANAHFSKYDAVGSIIGCPWFFIAAVHMRESSTNVTTCLHNGDPLPGPTTHVPIGRGPFATWEEAAVDALKLRRINEVRDWSLGRLFFELEAYNGFGYRIGRGRQTTPTNTSPYIFSGTQFYEKGKYASDGIFDAELVDAQVGCMAFIKGLELSGINISAECLKIFF